MRIATRPLPYRDGELSLTGHLVWDEEHADPQPGVLLVHGGAGLDDHARDQARRYAAEGFAVLACDMYGDGVAGDRARVMESIAALRNDPQLLVRRATAGITAMTATPEVDRCFAAVGFCFGGMVVLTLARAGAELSAVVSMHGGLATSSPAEPGAIKARVLACHGALDTHVPMDQVTTFVEEMNRAACDWQLAVYGGALHGFTHAGAVAEGPPGVRYNALADRRSFEAAQCLLAEALTGPKTLAAATDSESR